MKGKLKHLIDGIRKDRFIPNAYKDFVQKQFNPKQVNHHVSQTSPPSSSQKTTTTRRRTTRNTKREIMSKTKNYQKNDYKI